MKLPSQEIINDYIQDRPSNDFVQSLHLEKSNFAGQNSKLLGKSSESKWVLKFCRNNEDKVPEICNREAMTSLLGRVLEVPIVNAWVFPSNVINNLRILENEPKDLIRDKFVFQPYIEGATFEQNKVAGARVIEIQIKTVADTLAFLHWIGDEDRGLSDVMLSDEKLLLIDNGLCGPSVKGKLRGYHPNPEVYTNDRILLKCYGGGKQSLVEFIFKHTKVDPERFVNPPVIARILSLADDEIQNIVNQVGVGRQIADILIQRKHSIHKEYSKWLNAVRNLCER